MLTSAPMRNGNNNESTTNHPGAAAGLPQQNTVQAVPEWKAPRQRLAPNLTTFHGCENNNTKSKHRKRGWATLRLKSWNKIIALRAGCVSDKPNWLKQDRGSNRYAKEHPSLRILHPHCCCKALWPACCHVVVYSRTSSSYQNVFFDMV